MNTVGILTPDDYSKLYHTDKNGHIWVDGRGLPIPLTQTLNNHVDLVTPERLFNSMQTRGRVLPQVIPVSRQPINSTQIGAESPPTNDPTSPIMEHSIPMGNEEDPSVTLVKGLATDPNISEGLLSKSWNAVTRLFTPDRTDFKTTQDQDDSSSTSSAFNHQGAAASPILSTGNGHQASALTHDSAPSYHQMPLATQSASTTSTHQGETPQDSTKLKMAAGYLSQEEFDRKLNKHKERLNLEFKTMKSQLMTHHNVQFECDKKTMKQEFDSVLQRQREAHHRQMSDLQNQLAAFQLELTRLNESRARDPPPPVPPPNYPPPPPIASADPGTSVLNNSLIEVMGAFNQSMNQQCHVLQESLRQSHLASKEHYLSSATPCDGSDPKKFESWIEDVNRLAVVADKSPQMVAITTSKGNLHKYIIDLRQEDLTWVQIKKKLFERFSECGSSTMAKHRLAKLKQEDLAMHTYIAEFTKITEQAYSMHPDDPGTQTLTTTFIEGVNNVHVKNKLRGYPIGTLKAMFDNAINEDHKQKIRAIDFKDQNKSSSIFNTEINAVGSNKCFRCNKEGHFAKDCLLNRDKTQYNKYSSDPKTKGSENPIEQLSRVVTDLAAQVKRLQTPSHSSGIYQKSYQHKSSYRDNRDRRDQRHSDKRHHKDSRDHRHRRDHHQRSHNKPYTKVHEVEAQSDCDSECSYKSESESDPSDQDTSPMEDSKN